MSKVSFKLSVIAGVVAAAAAGAASATVYLAGGGWQYGQDNLVNAAQVTPITLDVTNAGGDTFSFTDGFIAGDIYTITTGSGPFHVTNIATFTGYPSTFNNNLGPYQATFAADWLNNAYSHFQEYLDPGIYTITVKDTSPKALPAGFGFRLDAVPEPATWGLMLLGVGAIGANLRRRTAKLAV